MRARALEEYINVTTAATVEGDSIITVSCPDYEAYSKLPAVVEFEEKLHGRTGWNSDRGVAYYKTSAPIASIIVGETGIRPSER